MAKQRIPYADPATITDPTVLAQLDRCRHEGTPRPKSQAIRAHNPGVFCAFTQAGELTSRHGVVGHRFCQNRSGKISSR